MASSLAGGMPLVVYLCMCVYMSVCVRGVARGGVTCTNPYEDYNVIADVAGV